MLLVEDHPDTREVLARLLDAANYTVKTASSVATALQLAAPSGLTSSLATWGCPTGPATI